MALRNLRKRFGDPKTAENTSRLAPPSDCERFLKEYEQAYAELRKDPEAWAEVQAERSAFDGTLMDGLEGEDA